MLYDNGSDQKTFWLVAIVTLVTYWSVKLSLKIMGWLFQMLC